MQTAKPRLGIYFMLHDASKDTCFYNIRPERAWLTYLNFIFICIDLFLFLVDFVCVEAWENHSHFVIFDIFNYI